MNLREWYRISTPIDPVYPLLSSESQARSVLGQKIWLSDYSKQGSLTLTAKFSIDCYPQV